MATPFLPHPSADHGGGVVLSALLRALAAQCTVELVSMCRPGEAEMARDLTWFDHVATVTVPRLADQSGPRRWLDHGRHAYLWGLCRMPLFAAKLRRPAMARALAAALERKPDAALLEFAVMAQYLPLLRRRCATVLTDHECGGHTSAGIFGSSLGRRRDARLWQSYLRRFYPLATIVQAVNAEDARALEATLGREVAVRPIVVDVPARTVDVGNAPARALFLGDYAHPPNAEAAVYLGSEVWPRVRAMTPHAELWLAGARAPSSVRQLEQIAGVRYVGFVDDLAALFAAVRLLLAPVLSGEGSRTKVITAAAYGVPIVANALALAGLTLPATAARQGVTADDCAQLTQAWLQDAGAAARAGRAARAWAEATLLPDAIAGAQLDAVRARLPAWRPA